MGDRYWVGGTANWDATAGSKWATTSGGAGGAAVPTAADDVYIDANAGGNVSVTAVAYCRSLNFTGYTGTFTQGTSVNIGDGTAGAGNIALKLVSGMTFIPAGNNLNFLSTSATQQTIEFGGKTTGPVFYNGASASWKLLDAHTSTAAVTLTKGALDLNSQTCVWNSFSSSNTNTRTLTMGSSSITVAANNGWVVSTVTGLTVTANTATLTMTGTTGNFDSGTFDWNGMSLVMTGASSCQLSTGSTHTFANFTRTGSAAKTNTITFSGNLVCTGTATFNGNSSVNRLLVASNTIGTARTITADTVVTQHSDWRDITGAGAGSWNLSSITGNSGDCGGNSGITFTTAATQTATGTASFSWSTHGWTSRVPLPQDDVSVPNAFIASRTVTLDMPRLGKNVTFSCTGTPAITSSVQNEFYGDLAFTTTVGAINFGSNFRFTGASDRTLSMGGNTIASGGFLIDRNRLTLLGDINFTAGSVSAPSGNGCITTKNYNVSCMQFYFLFSTGTNVLGTSTITCSYLTVGGDIVAFATDPALAGASSANFIITGVCGGYRRFLAYSTTTINSITYTDQTNNGALQLGNGSWGGTINTLTVGPGRGLYISGNQNLTITNWNVAGSPNPSAGLVLPGVTGNYAYVGDSVALSITGDIDILMCIKPNGSWSVAATSGLCVKAINSVTISYMLRLSSGAINLLISPDGTTFRSASSSALTSTVFSSGSLGWIRATWTQSTNVANFYTSSDGTTWTLLGSSNVALSGACASIYDSTSMVEIGTMYGGSLFPFLGNIYRCIIKNGINGTTVLDVDFTTKTFGSDTLVESSSNGATVTITGSDYTVFSDGRVGLRGTSSGVACTVSKPKETIVSDYLVLKDCTGTGGATFYAGSHSVNVSNNTGWVFTDPMSIYPKSIVMM